MEQRDKIVWYLMVGGGLSLFVKRIIPFSDKEKESYK